MDNLALSQESLFEMIRLATVSLADMKASLQPKIYAEMMTIRLAEIKPESAVSGVVESEISALRQEVVRLKQELANVGTAPKQVAPVPSRSVTSKTVYRVDRNKVQSILQEAVENPDLARQNLIRLQNAWGEVIESLAGPDKALLVGSQPVAANEHHAILAAGFSPEILAISLEEWKEVRAAFSAKNKSSQADQEVEEERLIPEGFEFLADKVMVEED